MTRKDYVLIHTHEAKYAIFHSVRLDGNHTDCGMEVPFTYSNFLNNKLVRVESLYRDPVDLCVRCKRARSERQWIRPKNNDMHVLSHRVSEVEW